MGMILSVETIASFNEEREVIEKFVRAKFAQCWIKISDQIPPSKVDILLYDKRRENYETSMIINNTIELYEKFIHISQIAEYFTHWTYLEGPKDD